MWDPIGPSKVQVKHPKSQQPNRFPEREESRTDGQDRNTIGQCQAWNRSPEWRKWPVCNCPHKGGEEEKSPVQTESWVNKRYQVALYIAHNGVFPSKLKIHTVTTKKLHRHNAEKEPVHSGSGPGDPVYTQLHNSQEESAWSDSCAPLAGKVWMWTWQEHQATSGWLGMYFPRPHWTIYLSSINSQCACHSSVMCFLVLFVLHYQLYSFCCCCFSIFEAAFLCVALAVLELTL